jgi:starch synthase (maltosyl-transferring)
MSQPDGRLRVVIEGVSPEIDAGRFAIKRTIGESVVVEADIFTDGHDAISAVLLYRDDESAEWSEFRMQPLVNDRWRASFPVERMVGYRYTLQAWVDGFGTWRRDLAKKVDAGQDVGVELLAGAAMVAAAAERATENDRSLLQTAAAALGRKNGKKADRMRIALDDGLGELMERHADRSFATLYPRELPVHVDRTKARFSTWYELFPRSWSQEPGCHGTFRDVEAALPYVQSMGFDVLYLPPIHPIGRTHRKGTNNVERAAPDDTGSPWAIGGPEGGHKAIHPELGTVEDFRRLVAKAAEHGIEVALDIAFQASPDHPYVKEHPEWFRARPDGSIQYAENPPKKYQDIYPFDFESERWRELWDELKSVVDYWIDQGVRIFRVDNPHTKPFVFWEWLIAEVRREHADVTFLSEAFTRPKVMYRLAKVGFTQSYTYFAWRNAKWELEQYFTELTQTEVVEYFRPHLWPNTPDILTEHLQYGGRQTFVARLMLAATLGANYGIYGPAFELQEHVAREPGSEEYLDSEKYQIRTWELDRPDSLREFIARINRIRRENPALHGDRTLRFHAVDNDALIAYSKRTDDGKNIIVVVVNLDPHHVQSGWVELPLDDFEIEEGQPYQLHDLVTEAHYLWYGARNYVEVNPHAVPAHIFRLRRRVHTEREFEYYL